AALQAESKPLSTEAILNRALRDAGKVRRTYAMKPVTSAHVGTDDRDAALIADVASGFENLHLKDGESAAKAALDLVRSSGEEVTLEKVLLAALRTRGSTLLARESSGGESVTAAIEVPYESAHVGTDFAALMDD